MKGLKNLDTILGFGRVYPTFSDVELFRKKRTFNYERGGLKLHLP